MKDRSWYPGFARRERHRQCLANIERLERWHSIFNEWADGTGDNWLQAVEMAKQGLTRAAYILKTYYLPPLMEYFNSRTVIREANWQ